MQTLTVILKNTNLTNLSNDNCKETPPVFNRICIREIPNAKGVYYICITSRWSVGLRRVS